MSKRYPSFDAVNVLGSIWRIRVCVYCIFGIDQEMQDNKDLTHIRSNESPMAAASYPDGGLHLCCIYKCPTDPEIRPADCNESLHFITHTMEPPEAYQTTIAECKYVIEPGRS